MRDHREQQLTRSTSCRSETFARPQEVVRNKI
jgi:hypothetical protein